MSPSVRGHVSMRDDVDIYVSSKLRRSLGENSPPLPAGAAHYSYAVVADKFKQVLRQNGHTPFELDRPEIYVDPPLRTGRRSLHLMFKPFQEFRLLNGAFNIAHLAWEFERLPTRADWKLGDPRRRDPFADYAHMLKIPDRLWVGSRFAQKVFGQHGVDNVDVVPAPIAVAHRSLTDLRRAREVSGALARRELNRFGAIRLDRSVLTDFDPIQLADQSVKLGSIIRPDSRIFVSIASPGDLRKNLPALIDGFAIAASDEPAILIIKLVIDNENVQIQNVIGNLLPARYRELEKDLGDLVSENIYLVHDYLPQPALRALYLCSDFYLCCPFAEGQNLPLQEAMAEGVIPVAPVHTAMADYLNETNAVVVPFREALAPLAFERAYGIKDLSIATITVEDVAGAVEQAMMLDQPEVWQKRLTAWETICSGYSEQVVAQKMFVAIE